MAAPTTYTNATDGAEIKGQLFAGKKFWVAQRVPHRTQLLKDIRSNGGEIVALEKLSDWKIGDQFRKDCPPGCTSYEFVDKSVKQGRLLDPDDFPAGGSSRPSTSVRAAYTPDEDRLLYHWVRRAERSGRLVGGNGIYKEIETQFPRHTWQSWRDRYLKKLRDMPASSFGPPVDSSPNPPSDQPARNPPSTNPSTIATTTATAKPEHVASEVVATGEDYSVNQLIAIFSLDDWEELYAFVEEIEAGKQNGNAWTALAEAKANQTAEQWRQYYEKVVRPQWLKDPPWKKKLIRERVEKARDEGSASQSQEKPEDLSTTLVAEDLPLQPSPAAANNKHLHQGTTTSRPDTKIMSSSTARHESPKYITEMYETARKRIREVKEHQQHPEPRPAKRWRSVDMSSTLPGRTQSMYVGTTRQSTPGGTQLQPLEISSTTSTSSSSQEQGADEQPESHPMSDVMQTELQLQEDISRERDIHAPSDDDGEDDAVVLPRLPRPAANQFGDDQVSESIESDAEFPLPPQLPALGDEDSDNADRDNADEDDNADVFSDLPPNSPTPRANRTNPTLFDPQALRSSPALDLPAEHPESDASTTQSLQEFRRSLNEQDSLPLPPLPRLPRPAPLSPARSTTSSAGSGDPDEPLDASELDAFYAEMASEGFSSAWITKALKRTRLRPELAATVLDAWREGLPLPNQRGVWSVEDDEAVESGDGVALALLERKHTLDGWGGITERVGFLQSWREG